MHRANLYKVHKFEVAFQQYKYQQALWKSFQEKNTVTIDFASFKVDAYTQKSLEDILAIYKRYFDGNQLGCYIADIMQELCEVFSNRPPSEIHELLIQMMDTAKTQCRQFKNLIRDFLILTKKIAPWDPSLYQKEVEELTQQIEQKKAVPGLVPDEKTQQSDKIAASLAEAFNFFDITN